jgi:cytoskeletal protein RodZ
MCRQNPSGMGDLGAKLREERERRGIGIDEIEAETRIRAKFLVALEEDRFEALPGPAYVRAFVRDYAEQLGLDPQEFVAELNARPGMVEDVVVSPPRHVAPVPLFSPRGRIAAWIVAVVAALLVAAAAFAYIGSRGSGGSAGGGVPAGATHTGAGSTTHSATEPATSTQPATTAAPPPARPKGFEFVASGGQVWLSVRAGSATGKLLYEDTLAAGGRLRFARHRLWVRVGAPWNLTVTTGGRRLAVPIHTIGDVVVTASGVQPTA